jgi:hypothetical protein
VLAASSALGWFVPPAESNALFLPWDLWQELGGYDERFVAAGGGYVNLDTCERAWSLAGAQPIVLLGEGTFHQFHGGVATNALESPAQAFLEEYVAIRGRALRPPRRDALYLGRMTREALPWLAVFADRARQGAS